MESIIRFFSEIDAVYAALLATTFTWLVTAMGASLVFFFKTMHRGVLDGMLGFTGGVMVAASFWSLLNPSIDSSTLSDSLLSIDGFGSTRVNDLMTQIQTIRQCWSWIQTNIPFTP